jgi:hypothetical protein
VRFPDPLQMDRATQCNRINFSTEYPVCQFMQYSTSWPNADGTPWLFGLLQAWIRMGCQIPGR